MGELSKSTNTIRFREETRQDQFYLSLRAQVQKYLSYTRQDGFATPLLWVKAMIYMAIFMGLYGMLYRTGLSGWQIWASWAGLGLTGVLMGLNVSHDAAHSSFFRNKSWNNLLYYASFSLLGANAYLWKLRHVQSHHLFPNVDECDADIDDNPLIRLSPQKEWHWYHRYQHWYAPLVYPFYSLIWVFIKDFVLLNKRKLANLRGIRHDQGQIWGFYLAKAAYLLAFIVAPAIWSHHSISEVLGGFLWMHLVSGSAFIYMLAPSHFSEGCVFSKLDKEGSLPGSWSRHQVITSVDYHATSTWANWIFGGFNAHAAHHLFPGISHAHYPAISIMIREAADKFGVPYRDLSWLQVLAAHFRYLKQMGLKPTKYQPDQTNQ
jgi:linoleoyl-CoA desaturase